jgi:ElaB/YqjD/DUF883 family membrane-anchored ribosome-binding protein
MKAILEKISKNLKSVHKHVLDNERVAAEVRLKHRITPLEFFNLLTRDEAYAWLKPFSALMAEIDEFIDETESVSESDVARIRERIEFMLQDPGSKIAARYSQYLTQDSELILAHARLRESLK